MVMNTPGGNTVSTAQLTMSLLSSLARHIPAADMSIKAGHWDRKSFTGVELSGKTLGVVGCGRIGQSVAQYAKALNMTVLGYDGALSAEDFRATGIKSVPLADIWKHSDFITVHTPLTPETSRLINDDTLAKCKKGVRIINCARGGIVDEAALLRGLENGHVAGAALDVFTSEPPKEHLLPLLQHPRLVCTPHLGASTEEAQVNVARDVASQMCDVFEQKDFLGVVNVNYLQASTQHHMQPFMKLAETLGAVQAQLSPSKVMAVTIKTFGGRDVDITTKAARALLQALVLKSVVRFASPGSTPDLISSPAMAKELGISSTISNESPEQLGASHWNLLSIEAERSDGSKSTVTGAVFGNVPHIVRVDQHTDFFAFRPEGQFLLSFRNEDRTGAISEVRFIIDDLM
jgi:D-3-phosphoglycerate dehydrogenase / 2-oxoglutarate reductase